MVARELGRPADPAAAATDRPPRAADLVAGLGADRDDQPVAERAPARRRRPRRRCTAGMLRISGLSRLPSSSLDMPKLRRVGRRLGRGSPSVISPLAITSWMNFAIAGPLPAVGVGRLHVVRSRPARASRSGSSANVGGSCATTRRTSSGCAAHQREHVDRAAAARRSSRPGPTPSASITRCRSAACCSGVTSVGAGRVAAGPARVVGHHRPVGEVAAPGCRTRTRPSARRT